ncbi:MAG TPA: hypothetical protein VL362_03290 [Patescibacteria group bacterium]|jgi:hypothetical protein|nr:hypothetical protein [Patescibacteria group bacterium]
MVARQPGRPSEESFIAAASRFVDDHYDERDGGYVLIETPFGVGAMHVNGSVQEYTDRAVILKEYEAVGKAPGLELMQFAEEQLRHYLSRRRR